MNYKEIIKSINTSDPIQDSLLLYLFNNDIIKNIVINNLSDKLLVKELKLKKAVEVKDAVNAIIKLGYIEKIKGNDYSIILTEKFYNYLIDTFEVEEDELPKGYDNIANVISKAKDSLKPKTNNTEIPDLLRYYNNSLSKKKKENDKKKSIMSETYMRLTKNLK